MPTNKLLYHLKNTIKIKDKNNCKNISVKLPPIIYLQPSVQEHSNNSNNNTHTHTHTHTHTCTPMKRHSTQNNTISSLLRTYCQMSQSICCGTLRTLQTRIKTTHYQTLQLDHIPSAQIDSRSKFPHTEKREMDSSFIRTT